jgi:hypothetical protein
MTISYSISEVLVVLTKILISKLTIGKESLHKIVDDNRFRMLIFKNIGIWWAFAAL